MSDERKHHKRPEEGDTVFFHKESADNTGRKFLKAYPLEVIEPFAKGNFQDKDVAIGGWCKQTPNDGALQYRDGVLFSEKPFAGRWSFVRAERPKKA